MIIVYNLHLKLYKDIFVHILVIRFSDSLAFKAGGRPHCITSLVRGYWPAIDFVKKLVCIIIIMRAVINVQVLTSHLSHFQFQDSISYGHVSTIKKKTITPGALHVDI